MVQLTAGLGFSPQGDCLPGERLAFRVLPAECSRARRGQGPWSLGQQNCRLGSVLLRELLIRARREAALSITDLARLVADQTGRSIEGVRTTIQRYEADGGPEPRPSTVKDVLAALGLELRLVPKSPRKTAKRA